MITPSDLWPPAGLTVTAGDLVLSTVSEEDLPDLVELVLSGVHPEDFMPFDVPWTQAPPEELPRRFAQYHWRLRASFAADDFDLNLSVRVSGRLVGVQAFHARDYPVTRTAETGSWLARRFQGAGVGTRMRQCVCALLFDHLGAAEVTSGAWIDNAPSLAVSRKVGYREGDVDRRQRQGALAWHRRLVLSPDDFVRGEPIESVGVEPLRAALGLG